MASTVYLISGANRGLGLALVTELISRPETVVFAGARSMSSASDLQALATKYPEKVHLVELTSADEENNAAAIAKVKEVAGKLDVVISNAGISGALCATAEVPLEGMREHFEINVLGPLALFKACYPLLRTSTEDPKFAVISSIVGSTELGTVRPWPSAAYGTSKAAVNWLTRKLEYEYPGLVTIPIHPGAVDTDMSAHSASVVAQYAKIPLISPQESAQCVLRVVDSAMRTEQGPRFMSYNGTVLPW
ncbi:NADP-binding protein [Dacryopinax primogenitus]|uniref:NADP-binding protein n=1 Tax=Dacryopinax primogenitus (strain DJM 731) TaxID=1858805 RepID=M5G6K3_DACPD|nr:NADP-binding protein [Dacryopinax primogenitus]EJU05886.1 NADP-binding protein [Dacryopinax primogenitus]